LICWIKIYCYLSVEIYPTIGGNNGVLPVLDYINVCVDFREEEDSDKHCLKEKWQVNLSLFTLFCDNEKSIYHCSSVYCLFCIIFHFTRTAMPSLDKWYWSFASNLGTGCPRRDRFPLSQRVTVSSSMYSHFSIALTRKRRNIPNNRREQRGSSNPRLYQRLCGLPRRRR
jgi:hypothetical protein